MTRSVNIGVDAPPSELFGEYEASRIGRRLWLIFRVVGSLVVLGLALAGLGVAIAGVGLLDPVTGILLLGLVPGSLPLVAVYRARQKLRSGPSLRIDREGLDFVTMDADVSTVFRKPEREVVPWSEVRSIEPVGPGAIAVCYEGARPSRLERRILRDTGIPEGRIVPLGGMGDDGVKLAERLVEWSEERQRREVREGRAAASLGAFGEQRD